eukprot:CAMPEP_0171921606 /NCGR_PEP_ID=MMETSP0993-20121228/20440_1 /TAXON_ID=483369 /ORGANISM="non described non described, Strain CCMP2098" /LENGTH=169 /DNA_ID=CAMNT_0012559049 /DNA_START=103 /DNA_END=608 /DNA_ORIENTATION=+
MDLVSPETSNDTAEATAASRLLQTCSAGTASPMPTYSALSTPPSTTDETTIPFMELASSGTLEDSVEANEALRLLQTYSPGTASQEPPVGTTSFGAATRWPVTTGALRAAEAVATEAQVPQQRSSLPAASEDMAGAVTTAETAPAAQVSHDPAQMVQQKKKKKKHGSKG